MGLVLDQSRPVKGESIIRNTISWNFTVNRLKLCFWKEESVSGGHTVLGPPLPHFTNASRNL